MQITWLDNWNTPIKEQIQTIVETLPDGKRKNTRSILTLRMRKSHHNTSLTCEAQNSAESVPQSTAVRLSVQFAPSVRLEVEPAELREEDTATFRCVSRANPAAVSYRWTVGGVAVRGAGDRNTLVLHGLNRTSAGSIVKCEVSNSIGRSEDTFSLNINCKFC